jgi:hypothetical protein
MKFSTRADVEAPAEEVFSAFADFPRFVRLAEVLGVALDVGVELRRGERPADHVAFQLGHVHAVRGEPAHRLVERGGDVAHLEDEAGDHAVSPRRSCPARAP